MKALRLLIIGVLAGGLAQAAVPPSNTKLLKPAEALAKMTYPDEFEVKVYAAEPDIGEVIAFNWDDRGRLWTVENYNYQTRRKHTTDKKNRIQIFEDTDGDGVFDKKKTFTEDLTFSSGIAIGMGGVYVGMPPELIFIPDADGDDKPDGPHEVLLDGWGIHDRHETLNSFIWGPDGWLYGCHGVFTRSDVGKPGAEKEDRQFIDGGIWRFHPVRKEFEVFAEGLSNPWGFDFNDEGQGFATCCVIPHLFHIVQGGIFTKQSRQNVNKFVYDNIKTIRDHNHKSAHGGARFYLADAFPERYHDRLFMNNIHQHQVLTDIMERKGSGYVGKHGDDFLSANDIAWVGFSTLIGPEGAVYVLDWHDQDICGNAIRFANTARIYRIMTKGAAPIKQPNMQALSDMELVEMQKHSNDWYVRRARVILQHRAATGKLDKAKVHTALDAQLKAAADSGRRLRALWALHVTGGIDDAGLVTLLAHPDEYVRAWSIQLLCEQGKPSDAARAVFEKMAVDDKSPVVRLYLASALQRLPFEQRWKTLEALAAHAEDVDDHNIPRMLWIALEPMVPDHGDKAMALAVTSKMPKLQEFVPKRILGQAGATNQKKKRPSTKPSEQWQREIKKVADGFKIDGSGERGVVYHKNFRNKVAVQTHPINKQKGSNLYRSLKLPADKPALRVVASYHPHGDWELRVRVNGKQVSKKEISSRTVVDEWVTHVVDLSAFAGKDVKLEVENAPTAWHNEWAYWHEVKIVSDQAATEAQKTPVKEKAQAPAAMESLKAARAAGKKNVVFLSGKPSHGRMKHEHRAGNMLMAKRLNASGLPINAVVLEDKGYPADSSILKLADTVVIFCTGHKGHILNPHLEEFDALMNKGVGVVMIHWATEAMKGQHGEMFLKWMGGFCDLNWSVNPHWDAHFKDFPDHPICNGLKPFNVHDEWYYHMRFTEDKKGLTPILFDLPPPETLKRKDGTRSGNPTVRKSVADGEKQTVGWAYEREDGGRGFGFTGGHNHESFQNDGFRMTLLNAIAWTAKVDVPKTGIVSPRPDDVEIKQNLD
jgi:putative membrane-bound dehydrogenase-like protein